MIGLEDSPRSLALDRDWIREQYPDLRALPRWATKRDLTRPTLGGDVAEIGRQLRTPFMAWQRLVADVGMELDPDGSLHYRAVIVTIHRQAGKTTLVLPWECHRCLAWKSRQRVVYTAQTLQDARKKFVDDQQLALKDSILSSFGHPRNERGSEAWIWANGSQIGIQTAGEKAGHGFSNGLVVADEAWAHHDWRLDQSLRPTMIRVPDSQWITISTAGDMSSVYLLEQVRRGRHAVEQGTGSSIAYFEWSIPLDADIDDPAVWAEYMPALGLGISVDDLRAQRELMEDADFRRAFGNQWVDGNAGKDSEIPQKVWRDIAKPKSTIDFDEPVRLAIDVSPDQSSAALAVAGTSTLRGQDGELLRHVEVIEQHDGTGWIVDAVVDVCKNTPAFDDHVALDISTPAGALVPALELAGLTVTPVSGRTRNSACAALYDAAMNAQLVHIDDPELNKALASAGKATSGDGWHWKRSGDHPIAALYAVTFANWALETTEPDETYDPLDSFF